MSDFEQCSLDDVRTALQYLDSDVCRDDWVKIGMAIKSEFADAFDLFDDWSGGAKSYKARDCRATWKSIRVAGAGGSIRIGTLFALAIERGYKPDKKELTAEEKKRFAVERKAREKRRAIVEAEEQAEIEAWYVEVARVAGVILSGASSEGSSDYLKNKHVKNYGVRFLSNGLIVEFIEDEIRCQLIHGKENIAEFFKRRTDDTSFLYFKAGCVIVPLYRSDDGSLANLQVISSSGTKLFLKYGRKSACWFGIGAIGSEKEKLYFAEGYSTAASIHEAIGEPVVVTFDCGNIDSVVGAFRARHPGRKFIIAADNDISTKGNPGLTKAVTAGRKYNALVAVPDFSAVANG